MHAVVLDVGRLGVRRRPAGREATALVDGDVDEHGAGVHVLDVLLRDELRRCGAGDQDRADDEVGFRHQLIDGVLGRIDGVNPAAPDIVELPQTRQRAIEDRHVGAEADRHVGRMRAGNTATDDDDPGGLHARHAAEQYTATAVRFLQCKRTRLDRQPAGNFRHRRQERQGSIFRRYCLVGNGRRTGLDQRFRLRRIGSEVQVREQHLVFAQHRALVELRLLDLDDHLGRVEHLLGCPDDFRAGLLVVGIGHADAHAGVRLDDHVVTVGDQLAYACRRHADTELERLDFLRYPYLHDFSPLPTFSCAVKRYRGKGAIRLRIT